LPSRIFEFKQGRNAKSGIHPEDGIQRSGSVLLLRHLVGEFYEDCTKDKRGSD